MEITNSNRERYTFIQGGNTVDFGDGVAMSGKGNKLIDMTIHDMIGDGASWFGSTDADDGDEITGCYIFNNGFSYIPTDNLGADQNNGHSIYTHTECDLHYYLLTGITTSTRKIRNNIMFNSFYDNLDMYHNDDGYISPGVLASGTTGSIQNYEVKYNILFNAGSSALVMGSRDAGTWETVKNILVDTRNATSHDVNISYNHAFYGDFDNGINVDDLNDHSVNPSLPYFSLTSLNNYYTSSNGSTYYKFRRDNGGNAVIGNVADASERYYTVNYNYFTYGGTALSMENIEYLDFHDNKLQGDKKALVITNYENPACYFGSPNNYNFFDMPFNNTVTFDMNKYYVCAGYNSTPGYEATWPFRLFHNAYNTSYTIKPSISYSGTSIYEDYADLSTWQKRFTNYNYSVIADNVSTLVLNPVRTGPAEKFYYPHDYEPGVCNIMIYNWDKDPTVSIDLSGSGAKIPAGNSYQIFNAQDILSSAAIIASGSSSGLVSISTDPTTLTAAQPNGKDYKDVDGRKINRIVDAQSTAPKFIPLVIKFFPYKINFNTTGDCINGTTITFNFKDIEDNDPTGAEYDIYNKGLTYLWTSDNGQFSSNQENDPNYLKQPSTHVISNGTYYLTIKDGNCITQTASITVDCNSVTNGNCCPGAPPAPGKSSKNKNISGNNDLDNVSISPNPFTNSTVLNYTLSQNHHVKIDLYDGNGKQLETIVNENQINGSHSYELFYDGNYKAGTYTLMVYFDDQVGVKKMVKL